MQSSRSKLMACLRKGRLLSLLRFHSNSTTTSDGGVQKGCKQCLAWLLIHNQNLQPTKICSQIRSKWNTDACIDIMSFYFQFEEFLSNLTFIYCISDLQSIAWSWRSALNFKFWVLAFLMLISCSLCAQWALIKNCAQWKYFNPNLCPITSEAITYID